MFKSTKFIILICRSRNEAMISVNNYHLINNFVTIEIDSIQLSELHVCDANIAALGRTSALADNLTSKCHQSHNKPGTF